VSGSGCEEFIIKVPRKSLFKAIRNEGGLVDRKWESLSSVVTISRQGGLSMEGTPDGWDSSAVKDIVELLGTLSGGRVLDVATGDGDFINLLMETLDDFDEFIGIDINEEDMESGREQFDGKPVELIEMNAEALEFEDMSFDLVSIAHSLHHLERIDAVLGEMKRVLKPDGMFVIQEMFCGGGQTEPQISDIMKHHWEERIDGLFGAFARETFKRGEIEETAGGLNLHDVLMFVSDHPVNCPFCEKRATCLDPMEESGIIETLEEIDESLGRLVDCDDPTARSQFEKEGEALKRRVKGHGIYPASTIFIIGRK
jgi:SAM-dependent methyltransferase